MGIASKGKHNCLQTDDERKRNPFQSLVVGSSSYET